LSRLSNTSGTTGSSGSSGVGGAGGVSGGSGTNGTSGADGTSGQSGNIGTSGAYVTLTAGNGLTGGGVLNQNRTVTLVGGTGIDVFANNIAVDVSDFMSNGANQRVLYATGTDTMDAISDVTWDGSEFHVDGKGGLRTSNFDLDETFTGFVPSNPSEGRGNLDFIISNVRFDTALGEPDIWYVISNFSSPYYVPGYDF
tara:strand:+ start:511 stop:1104 length:594 start_codon:yes stop_codon:yes gene_type:complete